MYQRSDVEVLDIRRSIDGIKALLTEHPFSAVPLSRVIGPRKRPVLVAPPPGTERVCRAPSVAQLTTRQRQDRHPIEEQSRLLATTYGNTRMVCLFRRSSRPRITRVKAVGKTEERRLIPDVVLGVDVQLPVDSGPSVKSRFVAQALRTVQSCFWGKAELRHNTHAHSAAAAYGRASTTANARARMAAIMSPEASKRTPPDAQAHTTPPRQL